jgi:hypothetical protein
MFNKKTNEALDQLFYRVNELEIGELSDLVTMTKMTDGIKKLERQLKVNEDMITILYNKLYDQKIVQEKRKRGSK